MDSVHLHLMLNHIPVLATIFSLIVLGWGMVTSEKSYNKLAMVGFIVAGIFSIIVLQTGEGAEEAVEHLAGVSEDLIHEHEEAAETTNIIAILLGLLSVAGFVVQKFKPALMKLFLGGLLLVGIVSSGYFAYTAYLGGQIRHTEIRADNGNGQTTMPDNNESGELEEAEHEDD